MATHPVSFADPRSIIRMTETLKFNWPHLVSGGNPQLSSTNTTKQKSIRKLNFILFLFFDGEVDTGPSPPIFGFLPGNFF